MIIGRISGATRTCSVEGCGKPYWGNSFCRAHNARYRRHGSPTAGRVADGAKIAWLSAHAS